MKNILVFSGAISPFRGSEFSVAWNFVVEMSRTHKLFVLYMMDVCKEDIDEFLKYNQLTNVEFFFCGSRPEHIKSMNAFQRSFYFYTETKKIHKQTLEIAHEIIRKNKIDCVHYLNPIGFKEPGYLWKLDLPYVWGPVMGCANWPFSCCRILSCEGWFEFFLRLIFHNLQLHFNLRVRKAFKYADVVVAATKNSQKQFNRIFGINCLFRPENALTEIEVKEPIRFDGVEKLKIVFAGSLIDRKGLKLFLHALSILKGEKLIDRIELHICGSGPLEKQLKSFCEKKLLDKAVFWHGKMSREDVQFLFRKMHLMVISSLGEATSTVLWEAMSKGIPILSLNHCGMGCVLTDSAAFLVKVGSFHQIVDDFAKAVEVCIKNPNIIAIKSKEMLKLAPNYLWENQIRFFNTCYDKAIEHHKL